MLPNPVAESAALRNQQHRRLLALERAVALRDAASAAAAARLAGAPQPVPPPAAAPPAPPSGTAKPVDPAAPAPTKPGAGGSIRPNDPKATPLAEPVPARGSVDEDAFAAVLKDLDALVGLEDVKTQIRRLAELLRVSGQRREAGLKVVQPALHMIFQGPPGTGKTTVARLFGRLYNALGLLGKDTVVEATRADLVSGYVGQTAGKTNAVVDLALDGILFIDEAYALVGSGTNDFGQEAVAELLKRMEDDRARLAVIAAGYPAEMTVFLDSNSGFRSRFGETITFTDYQPDELLTILERFASDHDYVLDAQARELVDTHFKALYAERDRFFANARTARNLFEDLVACQAERLGKAGGTATREQLETITSDDVSAATAPPPART